VTLPDTPPYATDGHLIAKLHEPTGAVFRYEDFNGKIGASDIHGVWLTSPASLGRNSAARCFPINCCLPTWRR
jgi:uncharacterized protein involved in outer membrane biogenesis